MSDLLPAPEYFIRLIDEKGNFVEYKMKAFTVYNQDKRLKIPWYAKHETIVRQKTFLEYEIEGELKQ